jgi:parallel beta-helix repeat protein
MGNLRKLELCTTLICILVIAAPLLKMPQVKAENSSEVNQLLVFFRDVLLIDTSRCRVSGGAMTGLGNDNSPELGTRGISQGKVTLTFDSGGLVDSLYTFRGKFLVWCLIYYDTGNKDPIPYLQAPSGDHLEMARGFLERYERFTNDSSIADMKQLLSTVNVVEPLSKTEGNLKMTITVREKPDFGWSYTFEDEDYTLLSISFFTPPHIFTLGDHRYSYNMNDSAIPLYEPMNASSNVETANSSFLSEHSNTDEAALSSGNFNADLVNPSFAAFCIAFVALAIGETAILIQVKSKRSGSNFGIKHLLLKNNFPVRLKAKLWVKKKVLALAFTLLLLFSLEIGLESMKVVEANFMFPPLEKIYIKNDGSISPQTNSLSRVGDVYTLTGNIINNPLEVQRDNIVINGAGFYLQKNTPALGRQDAISLKDRSNVTVKNLDVNGYDYGVYLSNSSYCEVTEDSFSNNKFGIVLADKSTNNLILGNNWSSGGGISIYTSANNVFRNNSIDGSGPNFWIDCENVTTSSDYVNDVDESNKIRGNPVYYLINQQNQTIPSNAGYVALINCSGITVENLNLTNNGQGILLISTKNTQVIKNNLTSNNKGIAIYDSPNNIFNANNLTSNTYGIVCFSAPNTFRNNRLENNTYDANFEDRFFDEFDRSNIVDGKPICYLQWQNDKTVPVDSGYVVLLSCKNITAQNLNITNRRQAMLMVGVTDSLIIRNLITNNQAAIIMKGSSNNKIISNFIANNTDGVYLEASNLNEMSGNKITFNVNFGIHQEDSRNNHITYNYLAHCKTGFTTNRGGKNIFSGNTIIYTKEKGIHIGESVDNIVSGNNVAWSKGYALTISGTVGNNSIHHNNFVNNGGDPHQAYPGANTQNQWDNGHEGNFWSDYQNRYPTGKQTAALDIWDTPVAINGNNIDRFPLTKPVNMKYQVTILQPASASSNASTCPVAFFATGPVAWIGYSIDGNANVTANGEIPFINVPVGVHTVRVYAGNKGETCASETIRFESTQNSTTPATQTTPSPAPSFQPSTPGSSSPLPPPTDIASTLSPNDGTENNLQFSKIAVWITLGAAIIATVSVATLFLVKRRTTPTLTTKPTT